VLVATPGVSIDPDGVLEGGIVKGNKELAGDKPFERHYVAPPSLPDDVNGGSPGGDYLTFVASNTTATQFDTNYKWDVTGTETDPPVANKRRVLRTSGGKTVLKVLMHDSGTEVARLNVWVVNSSVSFSTALGFTPVYGISQVTNRNKVFFDHQIVPVNILTDADRPDLTGSATGPGLSQCGNLANGATIRWDASRQVYTAVTKTPPTLFLSSLDCADRHFHFYPTGPDANVIGNDDAQTDDEHDMPTSGGLITSNDKPTRFVKHSEGADGNKVTFNLFFREFTRLKINDSWYRISQFHLWRIDFGFLKNGPAWEVDDDTTQLLPYSN
jgi:hypothetical protein